VEVKDLGYRLDLADPVRRIAVEYDGLHHDDPTQQSKDRTRRNRLQAAGWIVIVVDRRIFRHQREDILRQVEAAYRLTALRGAA
jgi:very-short-patch-repair endonuclease